MNKIKSVAAACIMAVLVSVLAGCSLGVLPNKDEADTSVADRGGIAEQASLEQQAANVNTLNKFIEQYNKSVSDDLKVTDYQVFQDGDSYTVVSGNGMKYTARLDTNGDVMTFTAANGTAEQRVAASSAVMAMLWDRKYVPDDKQAFINAINRDVSELLIVIATERAAMASSKPDTTLPDYVALADKANAILQEFERYKADILGGQ